MIINARKFFDGSIALAGCMGSGNQVAAALAMGADFAYMGTRFIATKVRAKIGWLSFIWLPRMLTSGITTGVTSPGRVQANDCR